MDISIISTSEKTVVSVNVHLIQGEPNFRKFENIVRKIPVLVSDVYEIDLKRCEYVDTRAIAIILEIHQALKKKGRSLGLVNVNEDITEFIKAISLDKIIQLK